MKSEYSTIIWIVGLAKLTIINHTKDQSLSNEDDAMYIVEFDGSPMWTSNQEAN